ncbi:hypothetical protein [Kroppenstedtia guangzhouensis]|uniref:hypothetical protein n=1 Tax=Kroppenstedtia guangzhouensis TaxID=1274356 RepID=UPI0016686378|nr:hypothetical protein [Kroppenstedtia guangzhouensis]
MNKRFLPVEYQCRRCGGRFVMTEYPADLCWFCGSDKITPHGEDHTDRNDRGGDHRK